MAFLRVIVNLIMFIVVSCFTSNSVNVWGPGLEPDRIVLPARYIFIQTNISKSDVMPLEDFTFKIIGVNGKQACRIRSNVLNRKDGVYIFRYKLYESCDSMQIILMHKNKHIANSPYIFKKIQSDDCNCPVNINKMLEAFGCTSVPKQIIKDLSKFSTIGWDVWRQEVVKKFHNPGAVSLCHYIIKNNIVSRKCYGKYTGFKMFMDSILVSLTRRVYLPDNEFFVNLGDWPLSTKSNKYPILSWCGSTHSFDIVMPTYDITESTLENLGRVTLDMLSVQGNAKYQWEERIPKAFWRGRDSNKNRLALIDISRKFPELFNVSLTNFFFYRDKEAEYGPKSEHISFFDFFDYKYQVSIDGTVATYRFPYLLAGGSLVLKQDSIYYEHFYDELKPNVHYVPVREDLSNLVEKLNWAGSADGQAKKIALESQKFAMENLLPTNIFCYYTHLLNEYSKKLKDPVKLLEDMEVVEQHAQSRKCECNSYRKDEL